MDITNKNNTAAPYIAVVGGCNMDICGRPGKALIQQDSNPGTVTLFPGGVGRNIAHNLALLGQQVKFISLFAQDTLAGQLQKSCTDAGIDISACGTTANASSSTYLFITNAQGDMQLAVSDMALYEEMTPDFLAARLDVIQGACLCVTDTNLSPAALEYLAKHCNVPLFADAVSTTKAKKLTGLLPHIHTLQLNRLEAEVLTGYAVNDSKTLCDAANTLLGAGLSQVFITLGSNGVYCANHSQHLHIPAYPSRIANTTGAGDSFMAALAWAFAQGFPLSLCAKAGNAAASISIAGQHTINPALHASTIVTMLQTDPPTLTNTMEAVMNNLQQHLYISAPVQKALQEGKAVVALESTIISHGMPYPQNVQTALEVERIVREVGAQPATIAILGGRLCVGLSPEEIDYLGKTGLAVTKASRRDIPILVARKQDGATTVAATMILAALAGIRVFATGGIGGVHRGAAATMDVSADLEELAATPVLVVCAGAKSILDLGLTLEYLETKGIAVIGYGTGELPAFYTRTSGFKVDYRMDSASEIADAFAAKLNIGIPGGMLVTNPIPEEYAMDAAHINHVIEDAVRQAERQGIKGKNITPFLLDKIQQITGGESLAANIQLVYSNAKLAAGIALALAE